jgi:opacity protein-like surface antigen
VNRRMRRMLVVLLVLMIPGAAAAQTPAGAPASASASAAEDEPLPRWDTTGFLGWRGTRVDEEYNYRRWDSRFAYGGTLGYYWTTNLKLELEVSATSPSRFDTYEPHTVGGLAYPVFVRSDHRNVTASFGGLVIYQFFENASFHPFIGGGVAVQTIRERIDTERQSQTISRAPNVFEVIVISEAQTEHHDQTDALGQIVSGFKAYPNERWFFRTDVQWSAGAGRFRDITWRLGVGVDF